MNESTEMKTSEAQFESCARSFFEIGENESKTKFESQARPLSEISEGKPKAQPELNEDSFLNE